MTLKQKLQLQWQQLLTTKNKQKEVSKETSFLYAKTEAVASVFCLMCEGIDSQKQGQGSHDEAGQDHSEHDCEATAFEVPVKDLSLIHIQMCIRDRPYTDGTQFDSVKNSYAENGIAPVGEETTETDSKEDKGLDVYKRQDLHRYPWQNDFANNSG